MQGLLDHGVGGYHTDSAGKEDDRRRGAIEGKSAVGRVLQHVDLHLASDRQLCQLRLEGEGRIRTANARSPSKGALANDQNRKFPVGSFAFGLNRLIRIC